MVILGVRTYLARMLLLGCVLLPLPGCPPPPVLPPDPEAVPLALQEYWPMSPGLKWTWRLYYSEKPGAERFDAFSMQVDQQREVNGYPVWHARLEAPWFIVLGFSWLFSGGTSGYLAAVDGQVYATPDAREALERVAKLPDLEGWKPIPLHIDLTARVQPAHWDNKDGYVRYRTETLPGALPDKARPDLLPAEVKEEDLLVVIDSSDDGWNWQEFQMVLAQGIGPVFGKSDLGNFYLYQLTTPEAE